MSQGGVPAFVARADDGFPPKYDTYNIKNIFLYNIGTIYTIFRCVNYIASLTKKK